MKSICGVDCNKCELQSSCKGCVNTNGSPFGGECVVAKCCASKKTSSCENCKKPDCNLLKELLLEINNLNIENMKKVTKLNLLKGSFVNLEYVLPSGEKTKLLNDNNVYWGNQICIKNSERCYGIVANEKFILICIYGNNGADAEIVLYKNRNVN